MFNQYVDNLHTAVLVTIPECCQIQQKQCQPMALMDEYCGRIFGAYQPGDQAASTVHM